MSSHTLLSRSLTSLGRTNATRSLIALRPGLERERSLSTLLRSRPASSSSSISTAFFALGWRNGRETRGPAPVGRRYATTLSADPEGIARATNEGSVAEEDDKKAGNQAARAEVSLRRFWKTVGIQEQPDGTYFITLDARPLRTPSGARLAIPQSRKILAMLIANEWENQKQLLKVNSLPMTSLAARALDGMRDPSIRGGVLDQLLKYLDTDTTLFPSDYPSTLVRLQEQHWAPLHSWLRDDLGVNIKPYESLVLGPGAKFSQGDDVHAEFRKIIGKWSEWEMAALERATYASKSFLIGFALVSGRLNAEEAAQASHVETNAQQELWGMVEDSHDVDHADIRRALGSSACLLAVN